MEKIEYKEIDKPIRNLIRKINSFRFCSTVCSCSGHKKGDGKEYPYVTLRFIDLHLRDKFILTLLELHPFEVITFTTEEERDVTVSSKFALTLKLNRQYLQEYVMQTLMTISNDIECKHYLSGGNCGYYDSSIGECCIEFCPIQVE